MKRKTLAITIVLGAGSFKSGGNTKTIEGLATSATITKPGLPEKNKASVKIIGMLLDDMAQATTLAFESQKRQNNLLRIEAGEVDGDKSVAFQGEITSAFADFNTAPDVTMTFEAQTGSFPALIPSAQETTQGEVQAASLIEKFAGEAGYGFQNEGVSLSVKNVVLNGSPVDKMRRVAEQVGCELIIDDDTVIILMPDKARSGNAILLKKDSGMIGYPTFTQDGIRVRSLYNPGFQLGGLVQIESIVPKASGTWKISKLTHNLEAYQNSPGAWFSEIEAVYQ